MAKRLKKTVIRSKRAYAFLKSLVTLLKKASPDDAAVLAELATRWGVAEEKGVLSKTVLVAIEPVFKQVCAERGIPTYYQHCTNPQVLDLFTNAVKRLKVA